MSELGEIRMSELNGYSIVLGKRRKSTLDLLMEIISVEDSGNKKNFEYEDLGRDVLVCGRERSGKNVGVIVPTLLSWKGSVIVVDKLFKNWKLTSDYRKKELNNDVYVFDPFFEGSCKINPFEFIKQGDPSEIETAKALAQVFVSSRLMNVWGKYFYSKKVFFDYKDSFCESEIQNLMAAVILYLKYTSAKASVKDLLDFFESDERENYFSSSEYQKRKFRKILACEHIPEYLKRIFTKYYSDCDSKTNHVGHFFRMIYMCLEPYRNENVINKLSTTDISFKDLLSNKNDAKKPISLYLNTSTGFYEYSIEWLRFLTNFFYTNLQDSERCMNIKQKVLLVLDELTAYCDKDFCETLLKTENKKSRALLLVTVHSLDRFSRFCLAKPRDIYKFLKVFLVQLFLNTSKDTSVHDPITYEWIYKDTHIKGDNINVLIRAALNNENVRSTQFIDPLAYYIEPYWMKKIGKEN